MLALRNTLFLLLVPGTLGILVPRLLAARSHAAAPRDAAVVLGAGFIVAGMLWIVPCVVQFHRHGGTPAPVDPPRRLVVRGPYRWTRNPMYLAVGAMLAGQIVWHPSSALLIYAAAVLAALSAFVVWYEEPALRARFGPEYADYAARVPRWMPRPPGRKSPAGR